MISLYNYINEAPLSWTFNNKSNAISLEKDGDEFISLNYGQSTVKIENDRVKIKILGE